MNTMAPAPAGSNSGISDLTALYQLLNGSTTTDSGNTVSYAPKTVSSSGNTVNNSGYTVTNSGNSVDTSLNTVVQNLQDSTANTSGTNVTTHSGSDNTTVQHSSISQAGLNDMLKNILEGTQGLAAVSSGQRAGGAYGSTVNTLLTNDLMARAAGQVAQNDKTVVTNEHIGGSTDTTNINSTTNTHNQGITSTTQKGNTTTGGSTQTVGGSSVTTGPSSVTTTGGDVTTGPSTRTVGGIDAAGLGKLVGTVGGLAGISTILSGGSNVGDIVKAALGGGSKSGGGNSGVSINTGGGTSINSDTGMDSTGTITDGQSSNDGDGQDHSGTGTPSVDTQDDSSTAYNSGTGTTTQTGDDSNVNDDGSPRIDYADGGIVGAADTSNYDSILALHKMTLAALTGGNTAKKGKATGDDSSVAGNSTDRQSSSNTAGNYNFGDAAVTYGTGANTSTLRGSSNFSSDSSGTSTLSLSVPDISAKDISAAASGVRFAGNLLGDSNLRTAGKDLGYLATAANIITSDNPGDKLVSAGTNIALNAATNGLYGQASNLFNTIANPTAPGIINTIASLNPVTAMVNAAAKLLGVPTIGDLLSSAFKSDPGVVDKAKTADTSTKADTSNLVDATVNPSTTSLSAADLAAVADASGKQTTTPPTQDNSQTKGTQVSDNSGASDNSGDSSGGGGAACVHVNSYLPDGRRAGEVKVGDTLILASADDLEPSIGTVTFSKRKDNIPGYWIQTSNGFSLICSDTAPIPTRDGELVNPGKLLGKEVAVHQGHLSSWDVVTKVGFLGPISVQHITVGNQCFWAGEKSNKFILHHNIKSESGSDTSGSGNGAYDEGEFGYADGGPIPGTRMVPGYSPGEKSDNIPINATAGEIIIPVDVAKNPDARKELLDIISRYHDYS